MADRVYDRTAASSILADHQLAKLHTSALNSDDYPYLSRIGMNVARMLEVDHIQGMQAAVSLAPALSDKDAFLKSVVGEEHSDFCKHLLKCVAVTLSPQDTTCLHREIALAVTAGGSIQK